VAKPKYGPWRKVRQDPIHRFEVVPGPQGRFNVYGMYHIQYQRSIFRKGKRVFEERKDEHRTVSLLSALEKIHLTPQHDSLVLMTEMGLSVIERIFERYEWFCRREEEKRRECRRKENAQKKTKQRVKNLLPTRVIEV
jgi:hypothetical protein